MSTFACSDARKFVSSYFEMETIKWWLWCYISTLAVSRWGQSCSRELSMALAWIPMISTWSQANIARKVKVAFTRAKGGFSCPWSSSTAGARHWPRNHLHFPRVGSGTTLLMVMLRKCRERTGKSKLPEFATPLGWKVTINSEGCNL